MPILTDIGFFRFGLCSSSKVRGLEGARRMRSVIVRVLDLDGGVTAQAGLLPDPDLPPIDARSWGPQVRLACSFRRYRGFRRWLHAALGGDKVSGAAASVVLYGSGDFHHVTLALLERQTTPFNLLVLDKHPDWMRGIPFLHCGTWLRHALELPNLQRVFHCGGELDFDNAYRWLAPWSDIEAGRMVVFPAARPFQRGRWKKNQVHPLLGENGVDREHLSALLTPYREDLGRWPLYISVDKDVLIPEHAAVNWDSGLLRLADALTLLEVFLAFAQGRIAGADVLGDWSPIVLGHALNRLCHRIDHPSPDHVPAETARTNARANTALLRRLDVTSIRPSDDVITKQEAQ